MSLFLANGNTPLPACREANVSDSHFNPPLPPFLSSTYCRPLPPPPPRVSLKHWYICMQLCLLHRSVIKFQTDQSPKDFSQSMLAQICMWSCTHEPFSLSSAMQLRACNFEKALFLWWAWWDHHLAPEGP